MTTAARADVTFADHVDETALLTFVRPLLGFPDATSFALSRIDEVGVLCELQAVDDPAARFIVVPSLAFFPDYAPSIDDYAAAALELTAQTPALCLLIVTAGDSVATSTLNTLAPVIVNPVARKAAQIIVDDPTLAVRTPFPL